MKTSSATRALFSVPWKIRVRLPPMAVPLKPFSATAANVGGSLALRIAPSAVPRPISDELEHRE